MSKHKTTSIENLIPIFQDRLEAGQSVQFSPQGISMLPMLRQNIDSVVLSPVAEKLKKYDLPLYRRDDGKYILHRIVDTGDTYTCMGDNQHIKEYGVRYEQIIGYVTEFYRGNRRHSIDETGYKIYCRVWYHSRHFRYFWFRVKRKIKRLIGR